MPTVRGGAERSNPMSKEQQLCRFRRAERSYSTFKVRMGDLVQGKEQQLCFAGAAVKRYPHPGKRNLSERASEGRHTETIITEN